VAASSITSSGAVITWTTDKNSNSQVNYGTTSAYGSSSALDTTPVTSHSVTLNGLAASTLYHYQARSADSLGTLGTSGDLTFTTLAAGTSSCPCTIWSSSAAPVSISSDSGAVEVGVKFNSDVSGYITGIRFYKGSLNTGTHTGSLWSSSGTLLVTATFSGESASGWQQVNFSTAVPITANTTYVASYHTTVGHYAGDQFYFATSNFDNPPLHALAGGASGGNGVYVYGAGGVFPNNSYNQTNYWVDVVFNTTAPPDSPPGVSSVAASSITSSGAVITWTTDKNSNSQVNYGTTSAYGSSSALDTTPVTSHSVTLNGLAASTLYHYQARSADSLGTLGTSGDLTFTTLAAGTSSCPCTIWSSSAAPVSISSDSGAVEVGVKFNSDVSGYITGIRFYKGSLNTGTHTGSLWSSSGTLLVTATFSGESASGWQQVNFSTAVPITANTTYVASYHTTVGHYAGDQFYFATSNFDNPPLHALASGGNGVYVYGAGGVFPNNSYNQTNYWVDVVFKTTLP